VVALTLAPLAVVQPIGVLALRARCCWRPEAPAPGRGAAVGAGLSVLGTLVFVLFASSTPTATTTFTLTTMVTAASAVAVLVVCCWLVSAWYRGTVQCIAFSAAGALSFGLGSTLLLAITPQVSVDVYHWSRSRSWWRP